MVRHLFYEAKKGTAEAIPLTTFEVLNPFVHIWLEGFCTLDN